MRLKLTLVLLLLNLTLFSAIFYLEKGASSELSYEAQRRLVLPAGSVEETDALEIDGAGLPTRWRLSRQTEGWMLTEPVQWPANHYAVESILNQLRFMTWETRFDVADIARSGRTLADYGLETPRVVLTIRKGEEVTEIRIGAPTQIGNRLYVLSPDQQEVFVVGRDLVRAVSLNLDELRSSAVFTISPYQVRSLGINNTGGARVRLVKRGEGQWEFESPIRVNASTGAVESLLAELLSADVSRFLPSDPAQQGLLNPRVRVVVEAIDSRQTLLIGNRTPDNSTEVFARLESTPAVFTIPAALAERLERAQELLREPYFNRFKPSELTELQISVSDLSITLQKLETGQWQVQRQPGGNSGITSWPAEPVVIRELLDELANLSAISFVTDAPAEADLQTYGFKTPSRRVVLKLNGTQRVLLLGDIIHRTNTLYAKLEGDPYIYEVSSAILQLLRPNPLFYRIRQLEQLPQAAEVASLRLSQLPAESPVAELSRQKGQTWDTVLEASELKRATALQAVIKFIRSSQVQTYISTSFSESMPLDQQDSIPWRWRLDAELDVPSGTGETRTRNLSFYFTERLGGTTQFGGSPEHQVTFLLTQELIDALDVLTFDRPVPPAEAPTVPEALPDAAPEEPVASPAPAAEPAPAHGPEGTPPADANAEEASGATESGT